MRHTAGMEILEEAELVPVLGLEPWDFAREERSWPTGEHDSEAWERYWVASLADSGVEGLRPIRAGSWFVAVSGFDEAAVLLRVLDVLLEEEGGVAGVSDDPEYVPFLQTGFALRATGAGFVLQPGCCTDFRTLESWDEAAAHRGPDWREIWIGHPWPWARFREPWIELSEPIELGERVARWRIRPAELERAAAVARTEAEAFVPRLAEALALGGRGGESLPIAGWLAGLRQR